MFTIALDRSKGIVAALAAVALALAAFSVLARATAKTVASAMTDGDSTMEGGQDVLVGRRIAGAEGELRRTGPGGLDLGVILGPSTAGFDIDPEQLGALAGPQVASRWLTLSANGANGSDLPCLGGVLIAAKLPVKLILFAITPTVLARSDKYLSDSLRFDPQGLLKAIRKGWMTSAKLELVALFQVSLNHAFPERTRIGHHARVLAAGAKHRLCSAIGQGPDALYAPDPDPWASEPIDGGGPGIQPRSAVRATTARELQEGPILERPMGEVADRGWYDPSAYRKASANADAVADLIRTFRTRGIAVWIVLLPERSDVHCRLPSAAMDCVRETLKSAFGADRPLVLDFRRAAPDEDFKDSLHLTRRGRDRFTETLAQALRSRFEAPR
jgi:hypothetical protein